MSSGEIKFMRENVDDITSKEVINSTPLVKISGTSDGSAAGSHETMEDGCTEEAVCEGSFNSIDANVVGLHTGDGVNLDSGDASNYSVGEHDIDYKVTLANGHQNISEYSQASLDVVGSCPHGLLAAGHSGKSDGTPAESISPSSTTSGPSRGASPQTASAQPQQHVVHVHINPGETFSVRVGGQIQHIPGPATVRMVSNNGPPLPMPMQVPPGHMVQQIVDENGILTNVILSPQPPGMASPPVGLFYNNGSSNSPNSVFNAGSYNPQFGNASCSSSFPTTGSTPFASPGTTQYSSHHHPVSTNSQVNHSPTKVPAANVHSHQDERAQKIKNKLQSKVKNRNLMQSSSPIINVDACKRVEAASSSTSNGHDHREENLIKKRLLKIVQPEVSEIKSRSALIRLCSSIDRQSPVPEGAASLPKLDLSRLSYELQLSDKAKDGRYKTVYRGDATEIALKDIVPATDYHLRVISLYKDIKSVRSEPVSFRTLLCEPDAPSPPKATNRTRTSINLKWCTPAENGSKIINYHLESDEGKGDMAFKEVYEGQMKSFKVTKLESSCGYTFRLAASNQCGKSEYSKSVCFYTSGSKPTQPDPPQLSEQSVNSLTLSWKSRPQETEYVVQMEDKATGHGFLTVYNGSELGYRIKNLRRYTRYRFRLSASNEEGNSPHSDPVEFSTLPDRPGPPGKPFLKGKLHSDGFKVAWSPPKDNGGVDVTSYQVDLDDGQGFVSLYEGMNLECTCDHLIPGHQYGIRVACSSEGGRSGWSETFCISTLPVVPGPCIAPQLLNKPKASILQLTWQLPAVNGGSPVTMYQVLMIMPDNTTRQVYEGPDTQCIVAGLLPGRPYVFQVRSGNKAGFGMWSPSLDTVTGPGAPDAPNNVTVHPRSPFSAIVSWSQPVNNGAAITEYKLEWKIPENENEFSSCLKCKVNSCEIKGLIPTSTVELRVQAVNSAGAGLFSQILSCKMPASSPSAVCDLKMSERAAHSIQISWAAPHCNGSDISSYNVEYGAENMISVDAEKMECLIGDLSPETYYKIRVQAVNAIGVGTFSSAIKVITLGLPPASPRLDCVCTHNSLKLRWSDVTKQILSADPLQYSLEMLRDTGNFHPVYHGSGHSHKLNKLTENTEFKFRICAINEAGAGPYSSVFTFHTTKAPPPALKAPKVSDLTLNSCMVEWFWSSSKHPLCSDQIIYSLQLQARSTKDAPYKEVYNGPESRFHLGNLEEKFDYQVRVCAYRVCSDGSPPIAGAYSPGTPFTTHSLSAQSLSGRQLSTASPETQSAENKQLSEQQWAFLILLLFALFAVIVAFIAQQLIATYTQHGNFPVQTDPSSASS